MKTEPKPIRELMPRGYTRIIARESMKTEGVMAYTPTICEAVVNERTTSKLWPMIAKLAKETDPQAFAERMQWLHDTRKPV